MYACVGNKSISVHFFCRSIYHLIFVIKSSKPGLCDVPFFFPLSAQAIRVDQGKGQKKVMVKRIHHFVSIFQFSLFTPSWRSTIINLPRSLEGILGETTLLCADHTISMSIQHIPKGLFIFTNGMAWTRREFCSGLSDGIGFWIPQSKSTKYEWSQAPKNFKGKDSLTFFHNYGKREDAKLMMPAAR